MLVIRLANGNTYPADRCTYRVDEATNKITHFDPNAVTVAVGNAPTAVGSTGARNLIEIKKHTMVVLKMVTVS
jgi:hypothetical protein